MSTQQFNYANPVFCCPVEIEDLGVVAVMMLLSRNHYGLIVCMHDSCFDRSDFKSISREVVLPTLENMPLFVDAYKEHMKGMVTEFPVLSINESYAFRVLDDDEATIRWPEGIFSDDIEDELWHIFIAPINVPMEEFLKHSIGKFN